MVTIAVMATPIIITNLAVDISSLPSKCFESETLSFELHATGFGFVQNEAFKRIKVVRPRRLSQHLHRVRVARFPTEPNAIGMRLVSPPLAGEDHSKDIDFSVFTSAAFHLLLFTQRKTQRCNKHSVFLEEE